MLLTCLLFPVGVEHLFRIQSESTVAVTQIEVHGLAVVGAVDPTERVGFGDRIELVPKSMLVMH